MTKKSKRRDGELCQPRCILISLICMGFFHFFWEKVEVKASLRWAQVNPTHPCPLTRTWPSPSVIVDEVGPESTSPGEYCWLLPFLILHPACPVSSRLLRAFWVLASFFVVAVLLPFMRRGCSFPTGKWKLDIFGGPVVGSQSLLSKFYFFLVHNPG